MTTVLPEGWAMIRVADYFDSWGGMTPSTTNASYWGGKVPWLSSKDIKTWRITAGADYITRKALQETRLRLCPASSVIVVVRSGILAHTLPIAVVDAPVSINQDLKAFHSPNSGLNEWLAVALRALAPEILAENRKDGTTVQSIRYEELCDLKIPVPPSPEQCRIAARVAELLGKVENTRQSLFRVQAILKRFRQSVLTAASSGRLTEGWRASEEEPDGTERPDLISIADRDDLPDLPESWAWTTIGALAAPEKNSITDGPFGSNLKTEHYTKSGPRVIRLQNISANRFVDVEAHISTAHFNTLNKHQIHAGDIAIACLGDPVPRACLIPESVGPAIVKADCIKFTPDPSLAHKHYLCYVLNDRSTRSRMSEIVHGVGRSRLNLQQIKSIPVPLPPLREQYEIVHRTETLLRFADNIERRVALAAKRNASLTPAILDKAFRGELVPIESELARREGREYEPASALLERIKAKKSSPEEKTAKRPTKARRAHANV